MSTLPRQQAPRASLNRDTQLRDVLETADLDTFGAGIISGGIVTKTAGYGVKLASGTKIRVEGVTATLAADLNFTMPHSAALEYLWATITRTPAVNPTTSLTTLDTYTVDLTSNTTGTAPSAQHVLVAIVNEDGTGVTSIDSAPDGKFLRAAQQLVSQRLTVPAGEAVNIPAGYGVVLPKITVLGTLRINGTLRIA